MAAQQLYLAPDNTSFTTFAAWAKTISDWFATCGWVQQNDTGQVVWAVTNLTLTQVASSGGNSVYSYSSYTGPAPRIGMSVVITGFATGGNNVTATITAKTGSTSGTFTVVTTTQGNETHAAQAVTTLSTLPGASSYTCYEIWAPGDALQTGSTAYLVRVEYGNSGTNASAGTPSVRFYLCTSTNGAGTMTGYQTQPQRINGAATAGAALPVFECNYSGDSSRISIMLWRNNTTSCNGVINIERTHNADGTDNSDGVTLIVSNSANGETKQQTYSFGGPGPGNYYTRAVTIAAAAGGVGLNSSDGFNGKLIMSPIFPDYGKIGYPIKGLLECQVNDLNEGAQISVTIYGETHTYIFSKNGTIGTTNFSHCGGTLMRID